jgi:Domain of unknown function (DUF4189)
MSRIARVCAAFVAAFGVLAASVTDSSAAGAMAIGSCAAYGYAYDYPALPAARTAALRKCSGRHCKLIASMQRACGAFAIDGHNACGAHGYAVAPRLAQAENLALQYCYKFGGRDCVIRAFACDAKG